LIEVVAATADSLDVFARVGGDEARQLRVRAFLAEIFELGECGPGWCFLAVREGQAIARVAFVAMLPFRGEMELYLLALPEADDALAVGQALIRAGIAAVDRPLHHLRLAFETADPRAADKAALAAGLGWPLIQEKIRYERGPGVPLPAPAGFTFRSYDDVGEPAFTAAVARVIAGTRDRGLADDVAEQGVDSAARAEVAQLRHLDGRTAWWELAYAADGQLVGLVLPQVLDRDMGVLNLVGVVPEARGRGVAHALVARGTTTLASADLPLARVIADVDAENPAMARALLKAGYAEKARRWVYRGTLA
jgi:ribosomal protein S18 acetylase RimI-like enzyme